MEHRAIPRRGRKAEDTASLVGALPYSIPVVPGIFLLQPPPKQLATQNALFIQDEVNVLFDASLAPSQMIELRDVVDIVLNTHAHLDHTASNYLFDEIWAPEAEADAVEDFESVVDLHGVAGAPFEQEWRDFTQSSGIARRARVARRLADNDVLAFGRTRWQVIHTPGHSPGHCCFFEPDLKLLFAGDITLNDFGPWYGAPTSSIEQFEASISLVMALGPEIVVTSDLGPITEGIAERFERFRARFQERDQQLLALLTKPKSIEELVDHGLIHGAALMGSVGQYNRRSERTMLEKHLDGLLARGAIVQRCGRYETA